MNSLTVRQVFSFPKAPELFKLEGLVGDVAVSLKISGEVAKHLVTVIVPALDAKGLVPVLELEDGLVIASEVATYVDPITKTRVGEKAFGRDLYRIYAEGTEQTGWKLVGATQRPRPIAAQTAAEMDALLKSL